MTMKFKVITRWPDDPHRSCNGGDYKEGYWLIPVEFDESKGGLVYRKEYFTSFEDGCCEATGAYHNGGCPLCPDGHPESDYEHLTAEKIDDLLGFYEFQLRPETRSLKWGMVYFDFYVEIDLTKPREEPDYWAVRRRDE